MLTPIDIYIATPNQMNNQINNQMNNQMNNLTNNQLNIPIHTTFNTKVIVKTIFRINKDLLELLLIKDCLYTPDKLRKTLLKRIYHINYEFRLKDSLIEYLKLTSKYMNIDKFIDYIVANYSETINNDNNMNYTYFQKPNYNI